MPCQCTAPNPWFSDWVRPRSAHICCVMISTMQARRSISLDTRILDLNAGGIPRFGRESARQLALALAEVSPGKDSSSVTVADLLDYLPARYEENRAGRRPTGKPTLSPPNHPQHPPPP